MCTNLDLIDPYRTIHPNRRDFSFIPRSKTQINRSRIDFFLISRNLFNHTSSCDISSTLQSSLFDHKAIRLSFSEPKNNTIRKPSISRSIIRDVNLDIVVFYSTYETYLHHLDNNTLNQGTLALNLLSVGRIKQLLRLAGTPPPSTSARRNSAWNYWQLPGLYTGGSCSKRLAWPRGNWKPTAYCWSVPFHGSSPKLCQKWSNFLPGVY